MNQCSRSMICSMMLKINIDLPVWQQVKIAKERCQNCKAESEVASIKKK